MSPERLGLFSPQRAISVLPSRSLLSAAGLVGQAAAAAPPPATVKEAEAAVSSAQLRGYATRGMQVSNFTGPLVYDLTAQELREIFMSLEALGTSRQGIVSASGAGNANLIPGLSTMVAYQFLGVRLVYTVSGDGAPGPRAQSVAVNPVYGTSTLGAGADAFTISWTAQVDAGIPGVMNLLVGRVGIVGQNKAITAIACNTAGPYAATHPIVSAGGAATDTIYAELIGPGNPRWPAFIGSLLTGEVRD